MTLKQKEKADQLANTEKCVKFPCNDECEKVFDSGNSRRTHAHDKHTVLAISTTESGTVPSSKAINIALTAMREFYSVNYNREE